mgnify:CR=1 FL=1
MNKNHFKVISLVFFFLGLFFLTNSKANITGAIIGISTISQGFSYFLGTILILFSTLAFVTGSNIEHLVGKVKGINTSNRELVSHSPLFARVTGNTIDQVFQTSLEHKYGEGIMGAKAIVYKAYDGEYHVAFLTETIDTHHRHAAATIARLKEGISLDDPTYLDAKADALYEGNSDRSCELLTQCAGFQLQYDRKKKKIIGIQQDSWLTNEQNRCNRFISLNVEEDMIVELFLSIDDRYLSDGLKNLDDEDIKKIYIGRRVT